MPRMSIRLSQSLRGARGFTLIELLVVIAIIATLVGILLPSLAKTRAMARLAVSLGNVQQIGAASQTYRSDQKGFMPLTQVWKTRLLGPKTETPLDVNRDYLGLCSWTFAGKNPSEYTATRVSIYDVLAADRPLNPYLGDIDWIAPERPLKMSATDPARSTQQMPVMRDPTDKVSYQRGWNPLTVPEPTPEFSISSYDDVGTSYHYQARWYFDIIQKWPGSNTKWGQYQAFSFGCRRLMLSDSFNASKQVWVNDQYTDVIINSSNASLKLVNGYGDVNKSVMGFMDGHAQYVDVVPGRRPESYVTPDYATTFIDLKIPGAAD